MQAEGEEEGEEEEEEEEEYPPQGQYLCRCTGRDNIHHKDNISAVARAEIRRRISTTRTISLPLHGQ
jgi:hypothetical protein